MKIGIKTTSDRIREQFARLLSCVLLLSVIYSATVGSLHSHIPDLSRQQSHIFESSSKQVTVSTDEPHHRHSKGNGCLICVLHRQFSKSIVQSPFFVVGLPASVEAVTSSKTFSNSISFLSCPIARHSGRAPPLCQA